MASSVYKIVFATWLSSLLYILLWTMTLAMDKEPTPEKLPDTSSNFLFNTSGCNIVDFDPFDATVIPLLKPVEPLQCKNSNDVSVGLVNLEKLTLRVNITVRDKVLAHYASTAADFYCCVRYLERFEIENDNCNSTTEDTTFTDIKTVTDEFMCVICYVKQANEDKLIYHAYDFAVLRKSNVEARCSAHKELEGQQGSICDDRLSIIIMGIDSVSRLQSIRHLNRTRQVLRRMEAIEFLGYSRVSAETRTNLGAPMLAGKTPVELENTCVDNDDNLDNCTFLMDYFRAAGYRTAYVADVIHSKQKFKRQPADYYGQTLFNILDSVTPRLECFRGGAGTPRDEAVFQWAVDYHIEFGPDKHFGIFWVNQFPHDDMNILMRVDTFMPEILERLASENGSLLNNTLLVVMSNHGLRVGDLAETEVGRYERNLPMLFLVFPPWYRKKHHRTMKRIEENARGRLTTPLDLHATLRDIAVCRGPSKEDPPPTSITRELSLFKLVTENRTCEDAGIPGFLCPCA